MKAKILKNENEYNEACDRIYLLIHSSEEAIEPGTVVADELELLSLLVEKYEQEHYFIEAPNPIEAVKFRMEQMNLKQSDLAPLFGGKTRVSEVLNGKRPLSLKVISLLNEYLGIPLNVLVLGNSEAQLDPERQAKLLGVSSIREYFLKNKKVAIL